MTDKNEIESEAQDEEIDFEELVDEQEQDPRQQLEEYRQRVDELHDSLHQLKDVGEELGNELQRMASEQEDERLMNEYIEVARQARRINLRVEYGDRELVKQ